MYQVSFNNGTHSSSHSFEPTLGNIVGLSVLVAVSVAVVGIFCHCARSTYRNESHSGDEDEHDVPAPVVRVADEKQPVVVQMTAPPSYGTVATQPQPVPSSQR